MKHSIFIILVSSFFFSISSEAKRFRNSYISFELPSKWSCTREATEYVCISQFSKKRKEATIIFTAKEAGPTDNLNYYLSYLKNPRAVPGGKGQPTRSSVKHVREVGINNHRWIDSLHLGSEVGSYYTRYLATVKDRLAILVTFSAHKAHYTKYASDFIRSIKSLTVVASKNLGTSSHLPQANTGTIGPSPIGSGLEGLDLGETDDALLNSQKSKKDFYYKLLGIILLISSIGLYIYAKKK